LREGLLRFHLPQINAGPFSPPGKWRLQNMKLKVLASAVAFAMAAVGCQQIPEDMTVAEYCSNADNAAKDVCKINVEIDGQKRSLAQTNMTVSEARMVADDAMRRASAAQAAADKAQTSADQAMKASVLNCETKTVQRAKVGTCGPGYKVQSCVQTRYTFRAGAPSILRQIDETGCRFHDQVLEMQVRCCATGDLPPSSEASVAVTDQPTAPRQPVPAS
jgi:hypothetical protein